MIYRSDLSVGPERDRLWRHEPCRNCGVSRFDRRREIETDLCAHCREEEAAVTETELPLWGAA